jgi:hypothetical protein
MATYASTTNPFIEPNESTPPASTNQHGLEESQALQRHTRKQTPGMAIARKSVDELKKNKTTPENEDNLLLDLAKVSSPGNRGDHNDKNNISTKTHQSESGDHESSKRMIELETEPAKAASDEDLDLEIGRACIRLVEEAAKMSVSDQPPQTANDETKTSDSAKHSSSASANSIDCCKTGLESRDNSTSKQSISRLKDVDDHYEKDVEDDDDTDACKDSSDRTDTSTKSNHEKSQISHSGNNTRQQQHIELMKKLRLQLRDLERYAYERGELEQVPTSILAERQSVILEKLRKKLSLNLDKDKIEKLEMEELKKQVDEEINNLIDPLLTKEHLLNQLKTQLTDLERYISHLHDAIGKSGSSDKNADCSCSLHGCSSSISSSSASSAASSIYSNSPTSNNNDPNRIVLNNDTLPKTSRLIRGLMAQLICSDIKIQEAMKLEDQFIKDKKNSNEDQGNKDNVRTTKALSTTTTVTTKPPQFHDGAVWTMHIDRIILATDSLTNLFSLTPKRRQKSDEIRCQISVVQHQVDESLVESVVRRQLVPALRDLLSYGLIDLSSVPSRSSYVSFLFDPYYLLSSFSCLPGSQPKSDASEQTAPTLEKIHVWNVIENYFESKSEVNFRTSSVKTLSQSFNLTPSMDGPIKITSKQALLIAIDDIIGRLAKRKPNGPESHFKLLVYVALNQGKLATWLRIIFRNKSILKKYYHDFSFVSQPEKMDKFLATIEALSRFKFNLDTDTESSDQFVSAF